MVMFTYANKHARLVRKRVMPKRRKRIEKSRVVVKLDRWSVAEGERFRLVLRNGEERLFTIDRGVAELYGKNSEKYAEAIVAGMKRVGMRKEHLGIVFGRPA